MEALTAEQAPTEPQPAARMSARSMFRYSSYVHVGDGAEECEHATDGRCSNLDHFHAWVRLPNPYQHEDIRRKALAAKARKIRELKDPDSDASVVLDQELAELHDPALADVIIDELLAREWTDDYMEAVADVEEEEEFEHIAQDREEYNRLKPTQSTLPEDEQDPDYRQLVKMMGAYGDAIRERLEQLQEPKRAELRSRPVESIIALARARRVEEAGNAAFMETYNAWMWFVGTFRVEPHPTLGRPHLPAWEEMGVRDRPSAGTMFGEAPEVITALKVAFDDLQVAMQRASAGNS